MWKGKAKKRFRLLADMLLVLALFWLPWWVPFILAVVFSFFFEDYIELIFIGMAIDALYAFHGSAYFYYAFYSSFSLLSLVLFLSVALFKRRLR